MFADENNFPKAVNLYLRVEQYPILRHEILEQMRSVLFQRGVVHHDRFEAEIEAKAVASQRLEGLTDPYAQELTEVWQERIAHVRDQLTLFYFAYNLPGNLLDDIIRDILAQRTGQFDEIPMTFNPELAPLDLLFQQGSKLENSSPEVMERVGHHLEEMKVVIIKSIISDQLAFIGVAKKWLTFADLRNIRARRFGRGKIGGKAAGVVLAARILQLCPELEGRIRQPRSYFIGTDVFNDFKWANRLQHVTNQKYKSPDEIREDFPNIQAAFSAGEFPERVIDKLRALLEELGNVPLVVRSSSLLEDSFGTSFAGKYESYFCPNQATLDENLDALTEAITQVYASVYNPDAMSYRRQKGLIDYDERMAVLIQVVEGETYGDYFFPTLAGVGFSHNPFRWTEKIDSDAGFLRLVWGLGTRAVNRGAEDYPRMIALSHPKLRPEIRAVDQRRYSQHLIDIINLKQNAFDTVPVEDILRGDTPHLRLMASRDKGGYLQSVMLPDPKIPPSELVLTFDQLVAQTDFVMLMHTALSRLQEEYKRPVDIEFTARVQMVDKRPTVELCLVQCRPQSYREEMSVKLPTFVPPDDVVLQHKHKLVPSGEVQGITHLVYVRPDAYMAADNDTRLAIARAVGRVNHALVKDRFVLVGPNRWGSNNPELGVKVSYADIHNTLMLIEEAYGVGTNGGPGAPQPSYGTHFYQDLIESNIYPLAIYPQSPDTTWRPLLLGEKNALAALSPEDEAYSKHIHVIDIAAERTGRTLTIVMDGAKGEALGFLADSSTE